MLNLGFENSGGLEMPIPLAIRLRVGSPSAKELHCAVRKARTNLISSTNPFHETVVKKTSNAFRTGEKGR
jgi:hypothetical protein